MERRKAARIEKAVIALYSKSFDAKDWDMTSVKDISETGIRINVNKCFSSGETIYLRIKIPLEPFKWLEIKGRVIASSLIKSAQKESGLFYMIQIEFIDLKEEYKELIAQYISWFLHRRA